jgi:hypothetical protein
MSSTGRNVTVVYPPPETGSQGSPALLNGGSENAQRFARRLLFTTMKILNWRIQGNAIIQPRSGLG